MKKIYLVLLILIVALAGYFLSMKKSAVVAQTPTTNTQDTSSIIWKGLGFEPGFYFEISGMVGDSHHTKLALQEGGEVEGDLLMLTTPGVVFHVKGDMLVGGDAAVPIDIQIKEKACTKPSGEEVGFSVTMNYADQVYVGCAEKAI